MKRIAQLLLTGLITTSWAVADQPMERAAILQLLQQLCQRQTTGWIPEGRIEAIHRSSDLISGEVTETRETVRTDGSRFAWQIRMTSDGGAAGSKKQDSKEFMEWNQDRTFIWDGVLYTLYFRPGNHAIVYEAPSIPVNVTGPLTAGHIPWGLGIFTFESLSAAPASATILQSKEGTRIQLSLQPAGRPQMLFILDPDRNNVVLSYILLKPEGYRTVQSYGNFIEQQGGWIPMNIIIDQYERNQLRSSELWEIVSFQSDVPEEGAFSVGFQEKALVEYHSPLLDTPMYYRYTGDRDIKPLLEKRLMAALKKEVRKQNCGTVAMEQVLSKFGVSAVDSELGMLVRTDSGDTSLYQLQQFFQQKGLSCLPVKTSISGLKRFKDAQVLLHLPRKKHFVLLDRVDHRDVWLIDLDRQTFYHSMDIDRFDEEWAGIALVISEKPFSMQDDDRPVPDPILKKITGSADYSCSDLIQKYDVAFCPAMTMGTCGGRYIMWYDRYGCQLDTEGGYCDGTGVVGSVYSSCIEDPYDPGQCTTTGNYISRYLRACQP